MCVFSVEVIIVSIIRWNFTKFFSAFCTQPQYITVLPIHFMSQLFTLSSWPQSLSHSSFLLKILSLSSFLDLCHISCIFITYFPVCISGPGPRPIRYLPSLSRLFMLTSAEFHSNFMARLGHKHMAIASGSSSALAVEFWKIYSQWCYVCTTL